MLRKAREIDGFVISGVDGELGTVDDLFFDENYWVVRYFRVQTGDRNGTRRVLISTAAVQKSDWDGRRFRVGLTREMVRRSPEVDFSRPVSRRMEEELSLHFGWPVYWDINRYPEYPGMGESEYPEVRKPEYAGAARGHYSLSDEERRRKEVGVEAAGGAGFHIHGMRRIIGADVRATDGEAGHVRDLLMSDDSWSIRYFAVDTRAILPGKHVLILPRMILRVDWDESVLYITVRRDVVRLSPEYDPDREPDHLPEDEVYDYYAHHSY